MGLRFNRTSICTVLFLDIAEYTQCTDAEQHAKKALFNRLISEATRDIPQSDRILLDTGDGAAIALLGAPEEALFAALTIRDGIHAAHKEGGELLRVRMGINLGPVRVVKDINDRPNIIGDGINVAQRIMSFAEPNQILVSRSYYEVTSRLTKEITELFVYSGVKQDKHVREHEVYAIGAHEQNTPEVVHLARESVMSDRGNDSHSDTRWWRWGVALVLAIMLALAGWWLYQRGSVAVESLPQPDTSLQSTPNEALQLAPIDDVPQESSAATSQKRAEKNTEGNKPVAKPKPKPVADSSVKEQEKSDASERSTWDKLKESVGKGSERALPCSDAERMLKKC